MAVGSAVWSITTISAPSTEAICGRRIRLQVQITAKGEASLFKVIPAAAKLQDLMLAPLTKEDRAHFLKCMLAIAKASPLDPSRASND